MSRIVAIGEGGLLDGYGLAAVDVRPAEDVAAARRVWAEVGPGVGLLILTPAAEQALAAELVGEPELVWAVVPA